MLVKLYNRHIKQKFFNKMFLLYLSITTAVILILAYMVNININISLLNKEKENNQQVLGNINTYFEQKISSSKNIVQNIYTNSMLQSEILYLMENGYAKHLRYKYDKLLTSPENKYYGFEEYFNSWLARDSDILGISIYSNKQVPAYIYSNTSSIIFPKDTAVTKYLLDADNTFDTRVIPSHPVHYLAGNGQNIQAFTVAYHINARFSSIPLGVITIDYAVDGIYKAFSRYAKDYKGKIVILTHNGLVVFDSSNTYYNKEYPYFEDIKKSLESPGNNKKHIIHTAYSEDSGVLISAVLSRDDVIKSASRIGQTVYLIAFSCIGAAFLLTYFTLNTFRKRINAVMEGIKNIRQGDLSGRINIECEGDEISEIAASINGMCSDLSKYIEKVYVSEIQQKNAQLKALQAQINPHFLYNTLESIRMRALIKGAKEVSDMIYLLSNLFRSSIKDSMIISIDEEIRHSRMYLELFNIRFMDKVKVNFDVKSDVLHCVILKHSIQPIIENYILYGLDMNRDDNCLTIKAVKELNDIFIYIMDNGTGISRDKLDSIKDSLHSLNKKTSSSMGLANVNERLKLLFGNEYGMDIKSSKENGTVVTLKIPAKTKEELDKYVQIADS